jgi:hypothetical protein
MWLDFCNGFYLFSMKRLVVDAGLGVPHFKQTTGNPDYFTLLFGEISIRNLQVLIN